MRQIYLASSLIVTTALAASACGRQDSNTAAANLADNKVMKTSKLVDDNPVPADPTVVEFRIAAGTGTASWNTEEQMVLAKVGNIVRIFNDDTIAHQLHTNGRPCSHGTSIAPGRSFDCVISRTYNPATDGALYDHNVGPAARFWMKADAALGGSSTKMVGDMIYEGTVNIAIPEVGDAEHRFTLEDSGYATDLSIELHIQHTYIGDLTITLFSPSGKSAILHTQEGGSNDNINKIYGAGGTPIPALANLNGEPLAGEWRLLVHDGASGDSGAIQYVKLSAVRVLR